MYDEEVIAEVCMNDDSVCPFDFLTDFDAWFYWQRCIHFDRLTSTQASLNVRFRKGGWVLCEGMTYGGWTYPNAYGPTSNSQS